mmetsp:Transcript_45632/g.67305  ORF Transcript_45632/g.67305 Transcript_45632/m.67305 type:complete len:171 (-) Transcript_45632:224-736(-)|eukprot:CAMPEP_0195527848 /NCGR_PEP_ID=MMETSP0794_2-20130614/29758_1 /TAXON_ID=515487 /ORGANISM="Stephanopyxis turris, Strain CCMP 815" /LENGTH=170 /DNA_ID=CAMNT_0040658855 /DNA_START=79 /DNA_END=591 /DNA_ORIENTATION=+
MKISFLFAAALIPYIAAETSILSGSKRLIHQPRGGSSSNYVIDKDDEDNDEGETRWNKRAIDAFLTFIDTEEDAEASASRTVADVVRRRASVSKDSVLSWVPGKDIPKKPKKKSKRNQILDEHESVALQSHDVSSDSTKIKPELAEKTCEEVKENKIQKTMSQLGLKFVL